jgi:hypothetical protein
MDLVITVCDAAARGAEAGALDDAARATALRTIGAHE